MKLSRFVLEKVQPTGRSVVGDDLLANCQSPTLAHNYFIFF